MPPNEIAFPLQSAVLDYFAGERQEGLLILVGSAAMLGLAIWLWLATRSGFSTAFAATLVTIAVLLFATAGSLLVRDTGLSSEITQGIESPQRTSIVQDESERIGVVISKYKYYRYAAAMIAAVGLLALLVSDRAWVHGVVAGMFLLVVAQILIDHYSEHRAVVYFAKLSVVMDNSAE